MLPVKLKQARTQETVEVEDMDLKGHKESAMAVPRFVVDIDPDVKACSMDFRATMSSKFPFS